MKIRKTLRKLDGTWQVCIDVGCDDLERAAQNRLMVGNKEKIWGYVVVENAAVRTPPDALVCIVV